MKIFIAALLVLLLVTGGVIGNTVYVVSTLGNYMASIESLSPPPEGQTDEELIKHLQDINTMWKKEIKWLSLTVNHSDLMLVGDKMATLIGAAKGGTPVDFITAKEGVLFTMGHIREMADFSVANLLCYIIKGRHIPSGMCLEVNW